MLDVQLCSSICFQIIDASTHHVYKHNFAYKHFGSPKIPKQSQQTKQATHTLVCTSLIYVYLWLIYALSMVNLWLIYGWSMVNLWLISALVCWTTDPSAQIAANDPLRSSHRHPFPFIHRMIFILYKHSNLQTHRNMILSWFHIPIAYISDFSLVPFND